MRYFRHFIKIALLTVLALKARVRLLILRRPSLIILTYHRVLPKDDPRRAYEQPGMVVAPETLEANLCFLKELGAVPTYLDEWIAAQEQGRPLPPLSFAVTFDDGWRDNHQFALPILTRERIPATVFLVSGLIGTTETFWPEQVVHCLIRGSSRVPGLFREPEWRWLTELDVHYDFKERPATLNEADEIIDALKQLDDQSIRQSLEECRHRHPSAFPPGSHRDIVDPNEIEEMTASGLIRFGAHTRTHARLNRIADETQLKSEILGSKDDLESLLKMPVLSFCYPNGDMGPEGVALVKSHFMLACTTRHGWNKHYCNPHNLRRYNIHDGNAGNRLSLLAILGR